MKKQTIRTAVSAFQAARVGHDKKQKSRAIIKLAKVVLDFLSAGEEGGNSQKRLKNLATMITGQGE